MTKQNEKVELPCTFWVSEKAALSFVPQNETQSKLFTAPAGLFSLTIVIVHCARKHIRFLLSILFSLKIFAR